MTLQDHTASPEFSWFLPPSVVSFQNSGSKYSGKRENKLLGKGAVADNIDSAPQGPPPVCHWSKAVSSETGSMAGLNVPTV